MSEDPRYVGKNHDEIKADQQAWADEQKVIERCLFCDWRWVGLARDGRNAHKQHRINMHSDRIVTKSVRKAKFKLHTPEELAAARQRG